MLSGSCAEEIGVVVVVVVPAFGRFMKWFRKRLVLLPLFAGVLLVLLLAVARPELLVVREEPLGAFMAGVLDIDAGIVMA